jgi:predicted ATP-grasp superfamily ATP-dependent carboligase
MFRSGALADLNQPAAIVYPAHTISGYATIRALGESGVPVLACSHTRHPHLKSRWAIPLLSPDFAQDPAGFVAFLNEVAGELRFGAVLYVMEDVFAYLIHRHRAKLSPRIRYPFLDEAVLTNCLDKQPMLQIAERAGLPIPWTHVVEGRHAPDDVPFPCLVKPLVSRFALGRDSQAETLDLFPRAFQGKCAVAHSYVELMPLLAKADDLGIPVCIQEFVPGPTSNLVVVYVYADARSRVLGAVSGRKLRQIPADCGTATLQKAEYCEPALEQAAQLVDVLKFRGIAFIEFKQDERTGELKLMEINPRSGHGTGLAWLTGVNLPYLQYADMLGLPVPKQRQSRTATWFDEFGDWRYFSRYRTSEGPERLSWSRWLMSLVGAHPAVLNLNDPLPGLLRLVPAGVWRLRRSKPSDDTAAMPNGFGVTSKR